MPKPTLNLLIWTVENANTLLLASLSFHCPLIHLRHPGQVPGQGLHAAISSAWNILPLVSKGLLSSNPSSVCSVFGKPAGVTTRGDSKCHRSRCEGEEADESFFVCESVNKMLGHHRSVTVFTEGQHLETADLLSLQVPKALKDRIFSNLPSGSILINLLILGSKIVIWAVC